MGISRFYSIAFGREKNFNARTDGLISAGDTTPDVSLYSLLYANTAGMLNVSYFDNAQEGQLVHLINLGAGIVNIAGAQMVVKDSANLSTSDSITMINHNSSWYEVSRSHNVSTENITTAAQTNSAPSVKNAAVLVLTSTAPLLIKGISGGYEGQRITIVKVNSCYNTLSNGLAVFISGTAGNFVMNPSSTIAATLYNGQWFATEAPTTGIA
jgi:hypothetical protein